MADIKEINDKIKAKKVVIISKSTCPNCIKVKQIMKEYLDEGKLKADQYEVIEIDNNPQMDKIQDEMRKLTGARTVPRVFINGKCIGGRDDTESKHNSKELGGLITAA